MPSREPITREFLLSILDYDPETGIFTRKRAAGRWGRIQAGTVAGGSKPDGYWYISVDGRREYSHRLAWLYMTGDWPSGEIDHIDMDPSNNRWSNLRLATHGQNTCNSEARSDNTSGYKGVYWSASHRRWTAEIHADTKKIRLGRFKTKEAAARTYEDAASRLFGEFYRPQTIGTEPG